MEFLDEDARPRYVFQSRTPPSSVTNQDNNLHKPQFNKPLLFITVTVSFLSLILSLLFLESEPFKSLLLWASVSLLIGPFAPAYVTGGDIRVGQGPILEPLVQNEVVAPEKRRKRVKPVRSDGIGSNPVQELSWSVRNEERSNGISIEEKKIESLGDNGNGVSREGDEEWTEEDLVLLKKQMVKNPVGKARRWEVIAEAFNGRFKVSSVIKKAKELGEKKIDGDDDSFKKFLKDRKPLDERMHGGVAGFESERGDGDGASGGVWSSAEDLALLNALKAFPKDVAMRWEKIAAAVPGKTKAACMKRITELKKDFRSSKFAAASYS